MSYSVCVLFFYVDIVMFSASLIFMSNTYNLFTFDMSMYLFNITYWFGYVCNCYPNYEKIISLTLEVSY